MTITWPDDHVSEFETTWLKEHSFQPQDVERRFNRETIEQKQWGSELQHNIPCVDFNKVWFAVHQTRILLYMHYGHDHKTAIPP